MKGSSRSMLSGFQYRYKELLLVTSQFDIEKVLILKYLKIFEDEEMKMKKIFIYDCEITYGNYIHVIYVNNNFDGNKDKFSYEKC